MDKKTEEKHEIIVIVNTPLDKINALSLITNMILQDSCSTNLERIKAQTQTEILQDILWSILGKETYRQKGLM